MSASTWAYDTSKDRRQDTMTTLTLATLLLVDIVATPDVTVSEVQNNQAIELYSSAMSWFGPKHSDAVASVVSARINTS